MCALARHDYAATREIFSKMSDTGRNERVTRYLMYKAGLHSNESDFGMLKCGYVDLVLSIAVAECLDLICRQSSKDVTLLYACVHEAQASGNKRQAIAALEKVIEKYDQSVPADVHLPALLR